ncbi:Omega-6 fatty acid desaturase, endoplasmic reticulum isozyme 2 [Hordeum vulgare]|nr:Omega-6 fatty acid desaturase, endoplasmic reticulum isozyme 2 [Hordeum vulgare]
MREPGHAGQPPPGPHWPTPTPHIFVPIRSPNQTVATSLHPSTPIRHTSSPPAISGMAGIGSESFTSRPVNHELIPRGLEEDMAAPLALQRSREAAALREHSNLQRRESIAFAQPVLGSGVTASMYMMRSF